jgi:hypothetical protein
MGRRLVVFRAVYSTLLLAAVWPAHADGEQPKLEDITGVYRCQGDHYQGTTTITRVGEVYHLDWDLGREQYQGVAIRTGKVLSSSWGHGIVVYEIGAKKLTGKFATFPSDGKLRTETLTFVKPLAKVAAGDWKVGDPVLVNWSRDAYWYPAKIAKKQEGRYFVEFLDGDEEWTTPTRISAENLEAGDRIFANWKGQGVYYPGRIASRDGQTIHINYDDGDRETTTIGVVRVAAPNVTAE